MSGRLPTWLADWFGVQAATEADGAAWRLESAWTWAPWVTVLLILAAITWTALLYTRESSSAGNRYRALLATLRLAAIMLLLVMLAEWALALRLTGPPGIAVVIDRSASMSIADQYDDAEFASHLQQRLTGAGLSEPTRLNLTKLFVAENNGLLLTELADRYRLETYLVAGGIERLPRVRDATELNQLADALQQLTADGPDSHATRLGDAVRHILSDFAVVPPAGVILLTDGVTTEGVSLADAAQDARRRGVPLVTIGLGSDRPPRDIELADVLVNDVAFVDDLLSFQVQVKASGLEGEPARVILRREDEQAALVEEVITLPAASETHTVYLLHRPTEPGDVTYTVEIPPRDDETNVDNNHQRRVVAVRDEPIRVLLVYGYPSYEFRFLKLLLERDPTIELSTYLQDADPEHAEQDRTALRSFPLARDALFEYDVLLVGDVDPRLLPRSVWQQMRAFVVEKGGGVALLAGPRYLPWLYRDNRDVAALLPIEMESIGLAPDNRLPPEVTRGFVVRPTPLGLRTPPLQLGDAPLETEQIWRNLAPLYWLVEVAGVKPAAQVWAEGPQSAGPVISFQYVGAGRVLFHAIDSTWRWQSGTGDVYFARYWGQTIRHLARGKLRHGRGAELTADRREYRRGEVVELRLRIMDPAAAASAGDEATVLVEASGQPSRRVVLRRNPAAGGVFEGSLADLREGSYRVLLAEPQLPDAPPSARFTIVAPPGEFARPEMDRAALAAAAEHTRGKFYTIADADQLLADLPAGRRVPLENLPPLPIWNRWPLLLLFLTCLTAEWILRKRRGML